MNRIIFLLLCGAALATTAIAAAPTPPATKLEISRGTPSHNFALRPIKRTPDGSFDSVAELTHQGKPFSPSLTVDEYTPGVWISWPDGASRAIAIGRDADGQNPAYLLDTGARRAPKIKLDFYPVEIYWRPDLGAALMTGPTGEGFRIGAVNVATGEARSLDISMVELKPLRWMDANRVELVGVLYEPDCSQPDPGGRCLDRKNPRPFSRIEDTRKWQLVP